jgi:hypothetical protein
MKGQGKLTAKGAKFVAALERFRDTLESGVPVEQRYTVRKIRLKLTPDHPRRLGERLAGQQRSHCHIREVQPEQPARVRGSALEIFP